MSDVQGRVRQVHGLVRLHEKRECEQKMSSGHIRKNSCRDSTEITKDDAR